jgi:hypothetical protein
MPVKEMMDILTKKVTKKDLYPLIRRNMMNRVED